MKLLLLLALLGAVYAAPSTLMEILEFPTMSDEQIDYINSVQSSWKAGRNFHHSMANTVKRWMGLDMAANKAMNEKYVPQLEEEFDTELPESFDPRDKWPHCPSLFEVRDQGDCGSCWAFGSVEAMTDRLCIMSGGKKNAHISAEDLLACCHTCGQGCDGGYISQAYIYYQNEGLVSGGQYNSSQGCQPYTIPACDHHVKGHLKPCTHAASTPECHSTCRAGYNHTFKQDKHFGASFYSLNMNVRGAMLDLYHKGPITAGFMVYSDFMHYKSGVYKHVTGDLLGGHAVKLMGWGVENGEKYWLVANSWNSDWGDKGYFKILRGVNECDFEGCLVAGVPKL